MKQLFYIALCAFASMTVNAQSQLWGNPDAYHDMQATRMFDLADSVLSANPPKVSESTLRKLALYNLDALLHETKHDGGAPLNRFVVSRMNKIISDIERPLARGMKIYNIYNMGFVVRTRSSTFAFDLVRGVCGGKTLIPDSLMAAIVRQCDAMFISHSHGDHTDRAVIEMFLAAGKEVVAPEACWNLPLRVIRGAGNELAPGTVRLPAGSPLQVSAWPGAQVEMVNNIYAITTPEGVTVMHTGDADYSHAISPSFAAAGVRVDVLLVHCWLSPMDEFVSGIDPGIIVCGHQNEMGHTIDHREAWWLTFRRMSGVDTPYVVMAWGESLTLKMVQDNFIGLYRKFRSKVK